MKLGKQFDVSIHLSKQDRWEQRKPTERERSDQKLDVASPVFHQFTRLPDELRLRIWELSMEPRDVVNESVRNTRFSLDPQIPTLFHVCYEARQHLQQFYTRIPFYDHDRIPHSVDRAGWEPLGFLINLDLDYLRMNQYSVNHFSEMPDVASKLRHIIVECNDHQNDIRQPHNVLEQGRETFAKFKALETVTLLHCPPSGTWQESGGPWELDLMDVFQEAYYTCDPVPYLIKGIDTCVPERSDLNEINPENYLRIDRGFRLKYLNGCTRDPSIFERYQEEVNGDIGGDGAQWEWHHTESCGCQVDGKPEWVNASLAMLPGFSFSTLPGFPFVLPADDGRRIEESQ